MISQRIEMDFGLNLVRTKITSWILIHLINTWSLIIHSVRFFVQITDGVSIISLSSSSHHLLISLIPMLHDRIYIKPHVLGLEDSLRIPLRNLWV